jgi:hypothetical protein
MSVKQKFRKSKKPKGKTKDNNKHKNNEKRSKIQRKTKKRVLRGGQGQNVKVSSTRGFFARRLLRNQEVTPEQCQELKTNIQSIKNQGNNPILTDRAEEDKNNCSIQYNINVSEDIPQNVSQDETGVGAPPPSPNSLRSSVDDDSFAPEPALPPVGEAQEEQKTLALPPVGHAQEEQETARQQAAQEAERLAAQETARQQAAQEAARQQAAQEANEQYQSGLEQINKHQENLVNQASQTQNVNVNFTDEEEQKLIQQQSSNVSNNLLNIFPEICSNYATEGSKNKTKENSNMCEILKLARFKRTKLLYEMLKIMKEWIIKNSEVLDFKQKLNEKNIIFNLVNTTATFYVSNDKLNYPDIDFETFIKNLYKLYGLSLEECCSYFLAMTSFQVTGESESKVITENFSLTSTDETNLQKIISMLIKEKSLYEHDVQSEQTTKMFQELRKYNAILPPPPHFYDSLLPIPKANLPARLQSQSSLEQDEESSVQSETSLLDFLSFIDTYLSSPETTLVCTNQQISGGLSTPTDVRKNIESLLQKISLEQYIDSGNEDSIFKTTCPFISDNITLKEKIKEIVQENNNAFDDNSECKRNSNFFLKNFSDTILMNIFLHMLVYACYSVKIQGKIKTGFITSIQGTDLMILYMKEFVIRFFNNLLQDIINFYDKYLQEKSSEQVLLIDKNTSEFFLLIDKTILRIETWDVKNQMRIPETNTHSQDMTKNLSIKIKEIKKKIIDKNNETLEFIRSLHSTRVQQPQEQPEKTMLEKMNTYNLKVKMLELCEELKTKVEKKYDEKYQGKRELWEKTQPVQEKTQLVATNEILQEFDPRTLKKSDLIGIKDECKEFVVSLISQARNLKKNNPTTRINFDNDLLQQLNRCCDPRDVFKKGENSREHNKRIARAFYGLSEIWPYIQPQKKPAILQLPGVKNLIEKFNTEPNFQELVKWQCNDDGKAEKKLGVRWWGMSANRKGIMDSITSENLPLVCEADVTFSNEKKDLINSSQSEVQQVVEPLPVEPETPEEIAARQRAEEEFAKDLAEAAAEIEKKSNDAFKLTPNEVESNLISIAQGNLETIDGKRKTSNPYSIPTAKEAIEKFKKDNPLLYTIALIRHELNIPPDKQIPVDQLARDFVQSRKVINKQINKGTYEPPTNKSLWQRLFGTGGSTSTKNKTNHKSNHKVKAKTQSKSKLKHRTKAKTIKKNKRAHHKFDKKYTRKR